MPLPPPGEVLHLLAVLDPTNPERRAPALSMRLYSWAKVWGALLLESSLLPACVAYTIAVPHVSGWGQCWAVSLAIQDWGADADQSFHPQAMQQKAGPCGPMQQVEWGNITYAKRSGRVARVQSESKLGASKLE